MSAFTTEIDVRFRDIDAMGHVNNAVYATYTEQARTDYFREVTDRDLDGIPSVLATLSVDFRAPVTLEEGSVTVALEVPELGRSSVPMAYEIRTEKGVAAEAETVQVIVDESGDSMPIPEDLRSGIEKYHGL